MPSHGRTDPLLLEQLNAHPALKARMITLLDVVTNADGGMKRADAAEQKVIEELRRLGMTCCKDGLNTDNAKHP